jgi:hypothetical protein
MNVHGLIQTARGLCADEASYEEIDALLGQAVDRVKDLETRVDELEEAMAAEARIIEAQTLGVRSLAKGRRAILVEQVKRMRRCALGGPGRVSAHGDQWRVRVAEEEEERVVCEGER